MALELPLIDIDSDGLVEWIKNGERADQDSLNRAPKDIAAVINSLLTLINDGEVGGSGQMLGSNDTEIKAISYNAQSIAEDITISSNLNAYCVGDITIDNCDITIESGAIWKIL